MDRRQAKEAARAEKDAARQAREREQEEAAQRAAEARDEAKFAASPVGKARASFARGDEFFQLTVETSRLVGPTSALGSSGNRVRYRGKPDLLGQIEDEGFRLEHVGYVFVETGATSTNRMMSTGQGTVTRGFVQGIYLFRRDEGAASD